MGSEEETKVEPSVAGTSAPISTSLNFSQSANHPRLTRTSGDAIRVFLSKYDQYCNEVKARAQQMGASTSSLEAIRPIGIKFCVDVEFLKSSITLGFITGAADYASLTDDQVRTFLDSRSTESKETVTLEQLDDIVAEELRVDMRDSNAKTRIQDLFASYVSILNRHGLGWIITDNQKVAVSHVLSAIKPATLKNRLESDLKFSKHELRKDFKGFLSHAVKLAEAFQLVDADRPSRRKNRDKDDKKRSGNPPPGRTDKAPKQQKKREKQLPLCLWPPHREKGVRHYTNSPDCDCPEDEKKRLLKKRAEELQRDGPSRSTRGQGAGPPGKSTTGRLQKSVSFNKSPSCPIEVTDGNVSVRGTGRTDDGSDDSIASPRIAEKAVLKGIGSFETIKPVSVQVALMADAAPQAFSFSRIWKVPRLIFELSTGRMALRNVSFLVADDDLSCEDVLIGLPVLEHLSIDSRTLLERNRAIFDGTDCADVQNPTVKNAKGVLGRLMVARLQEVQDDAQDVDNTVVDNNDNSGDHDDNTDTEDAPTLPKDRPRANYYELQGQKDPFPDPNLMDLVGDQLDDELAAMLQRAKDNGLPQELWEKLEALVVRFKGIFSNTFSSTPANIPPLDIELTEDAKPIRVKLRNYSASQRAFMAKFTKTLVDHGIIYPNPSSKWACAPLLVPKDGPDEWRFTVDLRPVNKYTIPHAFPMPRVEEEVTKTARSKVFAGVDFIHSFWQLALSALSQECQSFVTHENVWTPTRVLHGTTNAVLHLQSFLTTNLPPELREHVLLWVDDLLFHDETADSLLAHIELFFQFCEHFNIKLQPRKCTLFALEAKWCGRVISGDGVRFDPSGVEGLTNMDTPHTAGQLQKFLCAMQWLRSAIPQFQSLVHPLHEFMESMYAKVGKRTKRAMASVLLAKNGWSDVHDAAFDACKHAIRERVTLAHRDESKRLVMYTDASDTDWSGILTQVPRDHVSRPHCDQHHEPLAFYSGRFSSTQLSWSTLEKEAFAVMATIERAHWLASCPDGFDLYTDHNNLIFIFDPLSVQPDLGISALRKVLRWAVRLSSYAYVCMHIRGEDNIWADLLSRWTIPLTIRRLVSVPILPSTDDDFDWPSTASIADSQRAHDSARPDGLVLDDELWRREDGAIWIPDDDADLQLRIVIIAHCGAAGHRGIPATIAAVTQHFHWSTLEEDVTLFVQSCIHCLSTRGGGTVPRPFGPATHGTKPNDLVQLDYIDMGKAKNGDKYILMIRDDHSGYCWFFPAQSQEADTAADAIVDWSASFGAPNSIMSDGPTHFKNETIRLVCKALRTKHHITQPYCPWSNGGIERLGKELLRIARALLSEYQLRKDDWPQLVPLFQSIINHSPSPQRGNVAPITAFTGAPPKTPMDMFLHAESSTPVTIDNAQLERTANIAELIKTMDELHPVVQSSLQSERARMRKQRSKRAALPNFAEGDFVLVAREDFGEGEKLCLRWRGPRRITKALNDYVFVVEDLRNGAKDEVHGTRLKFYHDSSLDTEAIMSHVLSSETGMPVQRLLDVVEGEDGKLLAKIRWKGLGPSDDTFEPLENIFEDAPRLVKMFLNRRSTTEELRSKIVSALSL